MRRTAIVTTTVVALLVGLSGTAIAKGSGWSSLDELGLTIPSDAQIAKSIRRFDLGGSVTSFATESAAGSATTLTLAADLLFEVDKAELTTVAIAKIGELITKAPKRDRILIIGHSDSTGTPTHNNDLSRRRAAAVAAAIQKARPDLKLAVDGVGEEQPAVPESGDDIALDRRLNRRVTVSWTD